MTALIIPISQGARQATRRTVTSLTASQEQRLAAIALLEDMGDPEDVALIDRARLDVWRNPDQISYAVDHYRHLTDAEWARVDMPFLARRIVGQNDDDATGNGLAWAFVISAAVVMFGTLCGLALAAAVQSLWVW